MAHPHTSAPALDTTPISRRTVLSAGALATLALAGAPWSARRALGATPEVDASLTKPFARVEKIAEGVWVAVATPWDSNDFTTASNAGIIAGSDRVMIVEGTYTLAGGAWVASTAKALAGKWPAVIALTHMHPDHANGLCGCMNPEVRTSIVSTAGTRRLRAERDTDPAGVKFDANTHRASLGYQRVLPDSVIDDGAPEGSTIDLGGRTVTLRPHVGHTPSDMTIHIDNAPIVFCGDLLINGLFPYFGDAVPSKLGATCRTLLADPDVAYVPGHGDVATPELIRNYLALLDHLEAAARDAHAKGITPAEAAKTYAVPASLGEWKTPVDGFYEMAFNAWERELDPL